MSKHLSFCSFQYLQSRTTAPCRTWSQSLLMSYLRPSALLWSYCSQRCVNVILPSLMYTLPLMKILSYVSISIPLNRRSFCARTHWTDFVTWSVSRRRPSFVALHLTLSSFKRCPLKSSWSSGLILIGHPKQWEAFHWTTLLTLTVIKSFILRQLPLNCLLRWPTWTWAQLQSRLVKHKTGLCFWKWETLQIMSISLIHMSPLRFCFYIFTVWESCLFPCIKRIYRCVTCCAPAANWLIISTTFCSICIAVSI